MPSVPLLGEAPAIIMSVHEASEMWDSSVPMPPETKRNDQFSARRIRLSQDGRWVVRLKHTPNGDAFQRAEAARRDYKHMTALGLQVLNHLSLPSIIGRRLFTIAPWVDDTKPCSEEDFRSQVPILRRFNEATAHVRKQGGFAIDAYEMMDVDQFSCLETLDQPFAHDVDGHMAIRE